MYIGTYSKTKIAAPANKLKLTLQDYRPMDGGFWHQIHKQSLSHGAG